MGHPLVEVSRNRDVTKCYVVTEDYTTHPKLCRFGVWVGLRCDFSETVVLSYEHEPEELAVGWAINGTTVIDPGWSAGTPPWGTPAPGASSVSYRCPSGGLFHQLELTSTSGGDEECLWVQVLYRHMDEANAPFHYGPSICECVEGWDVTWPSAKVTETQACLKKIYDVLFRYLEIPPVPPRDPLEGWLERVTGADAARFGALVNALQDLDPESDRVLLDVAKAELVGMVRWARSPGGSGRPAPPRSSIGGRSRVAGVLAGPVKAEHGKPRVRLPRRRHQLLLDGLLKLDPLVESRQR